MQRAWWGNLRRLVLAVPACPSGGFGPLLHAQQVLPGAALCPVICGGRPALPMMSAATCRCGTSERLLSADEHAAWAQRLQRLASDLHGPIYFLWGTDWEDAPLVNAKRLHAALPSELRFNWPAHVQQQSKRQRGSLASFLGAAKAARQSSTHSSSAVDDASHPASTECFNSASTDADAPSAPTAACARSATAHQSAAAAKSADAQQCSKSSSGSVKTSPRLSGGQKSLAGCFQRQAPH